ncbi:MAG: TatD family hydrolase [Archangium sp.]|nr:TatD family hydrolase [Archangium sp.]MDP3153889.1 TatD family hydrolase [Archangium sp.]MDP3569390.1 TatD family hydrolase [Archangium sp.]
MFFDPRIHPATLTDQDLETLQIFGVRAVLAVADATAHPATPEGLFAHFDELLGTQLPRLERSGLRAWAALGVHPRVLPHRGLGQVLEALPGYFKGGKVLALGQLGLSKGDEREEEALLEQLALAHQFNRPAIVSAPGMEKERLTRKLLAVLQRSELEAGRILVDGAVGKTVRIIRELGFYAGLTLHPDHLTVEKAVALVRALGPERLVLDTAGGDGASDILALGRAAHRLAKGGLSAKVVRRVTRDNAATLFGVQQLV